MLTAYSNIIFGNMLRVITILTLCLFTFMSQVNGQSDSSLVQFSGMVLDGTTEQLFPVTYTNVLVKDQGRGTFTDQRGFFSIVVRKGDVIVFSAIGYASVEVAIPDTLQDDRYSLIQLMTQDTINLPETVAFPWPDRDHFKLEFLAMDVTQELQQRAVENLAQETLESGRDKVSVDANESADLYLREQASAYYYNGQRPPMNIFNPIAWKKFFDAWKQGDFKNKKKK